MVKLHTPLLAVSLAMGSAMASSNDYQRRSEQDGNMQQGVAAHRHLRFGLACARHNNLQSRGFVDEEDLFVRDDAFDDLEAREPVKFKAAGNAVRYGSRIANHPRTQNTLNAIEVGSQIYNTGSQIYSTVRSRGLEDDADHFVRDLDAFDDLEVREPVKFKAAGNAVRYGSRIANHPRTQNTLNAIEVGSQIYSTGSQIYSTVRSRGLDDDADYFVRDLDAFDDLEAREPFSFSYKSAGSYSSLFKAGKKLTKHKNFKHAKHALTAIDNGSQAYDALQNRGLEDDEDIFVRDLEAEELFGREYDILDGRDTFDDLD